MTTIIKTHFIKDLLSNPATIPTLLVLAVVGLYIKNVVLDPLKHLPGPYITRFTRLWEVYKHWQGDFHKTNIELHRKYGPVVRIGPGRYSIDDREAVKKIYGHGSKFSKTMFYHPFGGFVEPEKANIFQEQNEVRHAQNRRKIANLYAMSSLVAYETFVDKCTHLLTSKFDEFSQNKQSLDVAEWTQFYAFDVIGEITVGGSFNMMARGADDQGILGQIEYFNSYGSFVGLLPEWNNWIRYVVDGLGLGDINTGVNAFITKHLNERKTGKATSDRTDFLTKLLQMKEEGTKGIDDFSVFDTVGMNIGAGSDTTGLSLAATIYYLEKNPACKAKLREEIDRADAEGKLSDPITFKEAQELHYLQAVIREALRMHPATGQIMPRLVPGEGAELCGTFFPAGTQVGTNSWVLHANKSIFGEDAQVFRPERWLGPKEQVSLMNENMFAFGAGARTCIGKNISLLEMTKVIPHIYRRYDFEILDKEWTTRERWFVKQNFNALIKPRA